MKAPFRSTLPVGLFVLTLLLSSMNLVEAQGTFDLLALFQFICPIFKLFNLELNYCRNNVPPPSAPVRAPPVRAPVPVPLRAPVPTPRAPATVPTVPIPIPLPVPVPLPVAAPVPVVAVAPASAPKAAAAPMAVVPTPVAATSPMAVVPTPVAAPVAAAPAPAPTPTTPDSTAPRFTLLDFAGKFNNVGAGPICIGLVNRRFSNNLADILIAVNNDAPIAAANTANGTIGGLPAQRVCVDKLLQNGLNTIRLAARDNAVPTPNVLQFNTAVWAAASTATLTVNLVLDENRATRYTASTANITAVLAEDVPIAAFSLRPSNSADGTAVFTNMPNRTITFTAITSPVVVNGTSIVRTGTAFGWIGASASVTLPLSIVK